MVIRLKRLINQGKIKNGSEVFIITDNEVSERIFYRGSSKSSTLHDLVVSLRKEEIENQLIIHVCWVSGKRMIKLGVDGLSRGDSASGVMVGNNLLDLLPFNESALVRHPPLRNYITSWVKNSLSSKNWRFLTVEGWFDDVFTHEDENKAFDAHVGSWIWSPPPCLANIALEQLCEAKHIFPASSHIFVCPALMTAYWRKTLGKIADTSFTVKPGSSIWPFEMLEPLTIAFVKPLLPHSPWKHSRLPIVAEWESEMYTMQPRYLKDVRDHMRKFWR